ncbi:MAG: hypothetical protein E6Q61_00825 [Nitrosomonas sp.]|nr:MAG: hypothetical protein E6Q61_00825 [Nitrosomonas sp.]HMU64322.1 VTT domain-containing protein [Nitrosomonas sp.]HMV12005.1 VTT domain-containing protein [Nitrosomonas sp.]HMW20861.1 VTT domain-containing protein [Nitrosomonas sp.]HMW68516.1 VTT domain-containing protein [Nitrosomonas sp.]
MIRENLIKALIAIGVFVVLMAALGFLFEDELATATSWVVERIGFAGLCMILLVTDTFVTPFPPDILLIVIAKSSLSEQWPFYVLILSMVSVFAGMLGWGIGRWLGHFQFAKRLFGEFKDEHREFIRRYGFWAVVIGAITPLPFSVTCWASGVMGLRAVTVFSAAALFRIPRFFIYYWIIASTSQWF